MVLEQAPYARQLTLEAQNLSVSRGGVVVVSGITFTLPPGAALILRGNNGVGKSSLLRGIAGFSNCPVGLLEAHGPEGSPQPPDWRLDDLSFLSHNNGLYENLTVDETLHYWSRFLSLPMEAVDTVKEYWDIAHLSSLSVFKLSAGQKRRLALCRLHLATTPIWLMDEPSAALDKAGLAALHKLVNHHRSRGGILIQTAHDGFAAEDAQTLVLSMPERAGS